MNRLSKLFRLIYINYVLAKHGLDEIILALRIFAPVRFLIYLNPWTWLRDKSKPKGVRIRLALEDLGPIFVKFGQMLSTRPDLISEEIVDELELLQDKVPAFSGARQMIEKLYGRPIEDLFINFEDDALASASIAQVHAAELLDGRDIVVKVLRPNIEKIIRRDIGLLYSIARMAERYWAVGRRLRVTDIVAEFEQTILKELDLSREAANAQQLRRNFEGSRDLYVPEVYWPYVRSSVMVMERIHGIPVSNVTALREAGINLKTLAERGVEVFFTQVFRDCFFHADMHPGNIFVSADDPQNPYYIAVDFGIMGTLSSTDQRYLAENMMAFFKRDYQRVAELHVESGWVPEHTRVDELAAAIRTVCEPIFERPLKEISFGQLLLRLFQTGKQFHMKIQPQLLLLQKTLIHIEGLGRQLYPDLDLWDTAQPVLEKWLKKQIGARAFFRKVIRDFPYWAEKLPEMPGKVDKVLEYFRQEELRRGKEAETLQKLFDDKKTTKKSSFMAGVGFSLVFMALVIWLTQSDLWSSTQDLVRIAWLVGASGLFVLLFTTWLR